MVLPNVPGSLPVVGDPPLAFRFSVVFLAMGVIPNPLDTLFEKVSGLGSSIQTMPVNEGGQNLYTQQLPVKVQHENLVLERGLAAISPLGIEFNVAMSAFKFKPSNVLITLIDNAYLPLYNWLILKAYPVKWSVSGLDGKSNTVVIEHLELTYQRMVVVRA